jgi:hypothetical protein
MEMFSPPPEVSAAGDKDKGAPLFASKLRELDWIEF